MEEEVKIEQEENPIPPWIKWMWGLFLLWALIYLGRYWAPDLARWVTAADPDVAQWADYR
jgi:hypothetical protein